MKKFFAALICLLIMSAQVSAMNLTLYESVGSVSLGSKPFELKIEGYTKLDGNFSKGVAIFNGNLYFHFDAPSLKEKMPQAKNFAEEQKIFDMASRFGSSDFFKYGSRFCVRGHDENLSDEQRRRTQILFVGY